jgi:hypothetical protein
VHGALDIGIAHPVVANGAQVAGDPFKEGRLFFRRQQPACDQDRAELVIGESERPQINLLCHAANSPQAFELT